MQSVRIDITRIEFKDKKTPYSPRFDDIYFAPESGIEESTYVYLEGSGFLHSLTRDQSLIRVGEIGFGVGLNFLLTLKAFRERSSLGQNLHYFSMEQFPVHLDDLQKLYAEYPELSHEADLLLAQYPVLTPGVHVLSFLKGRVKLYLCLGEASDLMSRLEFKVDHWYWDGFAPSRNPDAFSTNVFAQVARLSATHAQGSSFTAATWVRLALQEHGFKVEKRPGFGRKRECITARLERPESTQSILPPWFSSQNLKHAKPGDRMAVIGAGLAGSAIARALAQRGCEVHVFDAHGIAGRASGNTVGLFNIQLSKKPNPISRVSQMALTHFLREIQTLSVPVKRGILRTDSTDETPFVESNYPEDFYQATPRGFFFPECGMLNPIRLCELRMNHPQIHFNLKNVSARLEGFDHVVYARGADSHFKNAYPLVHDFLDAQPTRPIRGQTVLVKPNAKSRALQSVLVDEGYASPLAPEITGHDFHLLGATYQAKAIADDQETLDTEKLMKEAKEKWEEFQPLTSEDFLEHRVGYRLSTPDKLPLIGPVIDPHTLHQHYARVLKGASRIEAPALPVVPREWVLTGLGSRGITFSSLGAEVLAALMFGEPLPIELDLWEHLHTSRFFVRKLRQNQVD